MPTLTDEQKIESEKRISDFREGLTKLSDDLQVDFISYPILVPDQDGAFRVRLDIQFFDKKNTPVPSAMSDDIIQK